MCAASDPNCSKSYKEINNITTKTKAIAAPVAIKKATTKTKAITAPVATKAVAPKSESSSTNGNSFKEIDINHIPKVGNKTFYIYVPFMAFINKVTDVKKLQKE
jgi:hypothetical protein